MNPRRSRLFAAAVLSGHLVILATQNPDPTGRGSNLLAGGALRFVAPFAAIVDGTGDLLGGLVAALRSRRSLESENRVLRGELVELRRERLRWLGLERETEELARALGYARDRGLGLRAAPVVYLDRGSWLRTMIVRVGARGARRDQVVLAERGVVGRVIEVVGPWARVQLLTDRAAAAGVVLERAGRQGIVRGGDAQLLELEYVPLQAEVAVGELVSTAGIDGVYPRGLPVGTVSAVEPGDERFQRISVLPAVDFGELSLVYLLERESSPPAEPRGERR